MVTQSDIDHWIANNYNVHFSGKHGVGKCLGENTPILMFDGSVKMVQDICIGESLMGPDSKPRKVLSICNGIDDLYKIIPTKGKSYIVNKAHILS